MTAYTKLSNFTQLMTPDEYANADEYIIIISYQPDEEIVVEVCKGQDCHKFTLLQSQPPRGGQLCSRLVTANPTPARGFYLQPSDPVNADNGSVFRPFTCIRCCITSAACTLVSM